MRGGSGSAGYVIEVEEDMGLTAFEYEDDGYVRWHSLHEEASPRWREPGRKKPKYCK